MKTFKGKPITLLGDALKVGDKAPDFKVVDNHLEEVNLSDFTNDYLVISVVPSLDTAVCDLQTKSVNEELLVTNHVDLKVLTISMDLPFAQARWVDQEELEGIVTLSDYLYKDFGMKFGVLIEELNLLARSVFVLNKKREVVYKLEVDEMTQHLDFDLLLNFINELPGK